MPIPTGNVPLSKSIAAAPVKTFETACHLSFGDTRCCACRDFIKPTLQITVVDPRWLIDHFCKLLQQNASGALALHEPASANGAVKPDASIIADLEDRVRRTLAQHLVWYDSTGRLRLLGIV